MTFGSWVVTVPIRSRFRNGRAGLGDHPGALPYSPQSGGVHTVSQESAQFLRRMHPNRLRFQMFADQNPFMWPVADWAEMVRESRRPVRADNPFLTFEHAVSDMIAGGLEMWGKARGAATEVFFFGTYGSPLL